MLKAMCTGCGQPFLVGPQAEAMIAEGQGKTKGYCAAVQSRVVMELSTEDRIPLPSPAVPTMSLNDFIRSVEFLG